MRQVIRLSRVAVAVVLLLPIVAGGLVLMMFELLLVSSADAVEGSTDDIFRRAHRTRYCRLVRRIAGAGEFSRPDAPR